MLPTLAQPLFRWGIAVVPAVVAGGKSWQSFTLTLDMRSG